MNKTLKISCPFCGIVKAIDFVVPTDSPYTAHEITKHVESVLGGWQGSHIKECFIRLN